jgi:hypothetical protein
MNAVLSALLPTLLQLLQSPAFQSLLKSILDDLVKQISSGVPPVAAAQQATGLVTAAAALHLTGNPVADIQALVANLQPHVGASTAAQAVPGQFTS